MKILYYCQHVLGLGHFFRTLEICRALHRHEVTLVSGGPRLETALPDHLRLLQLPELRMNREFQGLVAESAVEPVEVVKTRRRRMLMDQFSDAAPDLFVLELYPFGRKAFRFEIDPVLEGIRSRALAPVPVVCSLRDILVERHDQEKVEARVVDTLNRYFDTLLVHSDPAVFTLDETFSRLADIAVPVIYTGFVTPLPNPGARERMRRRLGLGDNERLVVASAGGGKVGGPLLEAVVAARRLMAGERPVQLHVFSGPYLDEDDFRRLQRQSDARTRVERFVPDFPSYLAAADLSVSMGGYNTCMNILAARVPALVWPFGLNQEQRLRAERLAGLTAMTVLDDADLHPRRLAAAMDAALQTGRRPTPAIDLNGARFTAAWIDRRLGAENTLQGDPL
jgi:predicted glycosyltransferase